jgi:GWxTD domain-containing protein
MRTKKTLARIVSFLSLTVLLGTASTFPAAQQQAKAGDQDKTKAAEQQQSPPLQQQKLRPVDLQKAKKAPESTLNDYYNKWLNEDVLFIISPEERTVFKALTTEEERENFVDQFWTRRNPDPREPGNSFKIEHYRRIAYANEHFASGIPGWKTDRGRIYILYGEPDGKESHPSGGSYQREFWEGGGQTSVYPFERWRYRHIDGVGDDIEIEFVDKTFTGEYRMAMDAEEKDALLTVPNAGLTESEEMGLTKKEDRVNYGYMDQTNFQRSKDQPFERMARFFALQRTPEVKFMDLKGIVSTRVIYNQLPYTMRADFIKLSPSQVLVPITIELDNKNLQFKKEMDFNRASVNVYGEVFSLTNVIAAEFENTISAEYTDEFFEQGKNKRSIYQKMVQLRPGQRYRLDLVLKDLNSGYVGTMSTGITVPKYDGDQLQASTVILANYVNAIPANYDQLQQFVIGDMKVQPNVKCEYSNSGRDVLFPYLQVYNAAFDQTTFEPSLDISYTIKSGDKVVQDIEDPKGRTVQFTSGERAVIVARIPVANMAPGKYTLEIKILDKIANKTLTTSADFQVVSPAGR